MGSVHLTHFAILMTHSRKHPFHKKVLLQLKCPLSGLRRGWRSQGGGEGTHLLAAGRPPVLPSLHRPSSSHELEDNSLPIPDFDVVDPPNKHYSLIAKELLSSLLTCYPLLNPDDIKLKGEHPISGGGFVHIWEATHNGRKVVLKLYRCYVSFNVTKVATVLLDPLWQLCC